MTSSTAVAVRPSLPSNQNGWESLLSSGLPVEGWTPEVTLTKSQTSAITAVVGKSFTATDRVVQGHALRTATALALVPVSERQAIADAAGISRQRVGQYALSGLYVLRFGLGELKFSQLDAGVSKRGRDIKAAIAGGQGDLASKIVLEGVEASKAAKAKNRAKGATPEVTGEPVADGQPVVPDRKAIVKAFLSAADALRPMLGAITPAERSAITAACTAVAFEIMANNGQTDAPLGTMHNVKHVKAS